MRAPAIEAFQARGFLGFASAVALPLAATIALAATEEPAFAAERSSGRSFDEAFADIGLPEGGSVLPPAGILEAAPDAGGPATDGTPVARILGAGTASYYGAGFAGRRTASGERFDPGGLTAAHRTLPFGSRVKVTNQRNGKSVVVRINDRGPFHGNRVIDLSLGAAKEIGIVRQGQGLVELTLLTS